MFKFLLLALLAIAQANRIVDLNELYSLDYQGKVVIYDDLLHQVYPVRIADKLRTIYNAIRDIAPHLYWLTRNVRSLNSATRLVTKFLPNDLYKYKQNGAYLIVTPNGKQCYPDGTLGRTYNSFCVTNNKTDQDLLCSSYGKFPNLPDSKFYGPGTKLCSMHYLFLSGYYSVDPTVFTGTSRTRDLRKFIDFISQPSILYFVTSTNNSGTYYSADAYPPTSALSQVDLIPCLTEGYFAFPNIPSYFYRCVETVNGSGKYQKYVFVCPDGLIFSDDETSCVRMPDAPPPVEVPSTYSLGVLEEKTRRCEYGNNVWYDPTVWTLTDDDLNDFCGYMNTSITYGEARSYMMPLWCRSYNCSFLQFDADGELIDPAMITEQYYIDNVVLPRKRKSTYWDASAVCGWPIISSAAKTLGGECNSGVVNVKAGLDKVSEILKKISASDAMTREQLKLTNSRIDGHAELLDKAIESISEVNNRFVQSFATLHERVVSTSQELRDVATEIRGEIQSVTMTLNEKVNKNFATQYVKALELQEYSNIIGTISFYNDALNDVKHNYNALLSYLTAMRDSDFFPENFVASSQLVQLISKYGFRIASDDGEGFIYNNITFSNNRYGEFVDFDMHIDIPLITGARSKGFYYKAAGLSYHNRTDNQCYTVQVPNSLVMTPEGMYDASGLYCNTALSGTMYCHSTSLTTMDYLTTGRKTTNCTLVRHAFLPKSDVFIARDDKITRNACFPSLKLSGSRDNFIVSNNRIKLSSDANPMQIVGTNRVFYVIFNDIQYYFTGDGTLTTDSSKSALLSTAAFSTDINEFKLCNADSTKCLKSDGTIDGKGSTFSVVQSKEVLDVVSPSILPILPGYSYSSPYFNFSSCGVTGLPSVDNILVSGKEAFAQALPQLDGMAYGRPDAVYADFLKNGKTSRTSYPSVEVNFDGAIAVDAIDVKLNDTFRRINDSQKELDSRIAKENQLTNKTLADIIEKANNSTETLEDVKSKIKGIDDTLKGKLDGLDSKLGTTISNINNDIIELDRRIEQIKEGSPSFLSYILTALVCICITFLVYWALKLALRFL